MMYFIKLNKFKQIKSISLYKEDETFFEIETEKQMQDLLDYAVIENNLVYRPLTENKNNLESEFDGKKWIVTATLEEQKNYYLNESLKIGKKMEEYKNIGLQGGQEYIDLEKELEANKNKYIELCQTEAIKINKHMDSTKPAK